MVEITFSSNQVKFNLQPPPFFCRAILLILFGTFLERIIFDKVELVLRYDSDLSTDRNCVNGLNQATEYCQVAYQSTDFSSEKFSK